MANRSRLALSRRAGAAQQPASDWYWLNPKPTANDLNAVWFTGNVDDAAIIRYNSTGDGALALRRSSGGDLCATGWSTGLNDNTDVLTPKVSPAGAVGLHDSSTARAAVARGRHAELAGQPPAARSRAL